MRMIALTEWGNRAVVVAMQQVKCHPPRAVYVYEHVKAH